MTRRLALLLLTAGISLAQYSPPQRSISARAGTVRAIQGIATIDGQRVVLRRAPETPPQMNNGQRLHVEFGRVELRLGPGAGITMTSGSTLHMAENRLSDVQLELEEGSALVKVDQLFKGGRLRVMFPDGAVELRTIGWYRFDAKSHTMRVYRGEAEVALGDSVVKAKKGQAVVVAGLPAVSSFNLKESDALVDQELARNREIEKGQRRLREQAALQRARRAIGIAERREANQRQSPQPPTLAQAAGNQ